MPGRLLAPRHVGVLAAALLVIAPPVPAWPHRQGPAHPAPEDAIPIPTITHGQMAVIADNRAAILALAERQTPTDRVMRRLQGFINIQFSVCLWGLMPGSLTDEDSPFNECSHAYLAATRTLLLHLQDMPGDRASVRALVTKIELEMLAKRASLVMCRYSDRSFNTSEVIDPDWRGVPSHLPSVATFVGLALTAVGCAAMAVRWKPDLPGAGIAQQGELLDHVSDAAEGIGRAKSQT